jgi:hypothetical protein
VNVYKKLNEARRKFHAIKLEKTGHNKFSGYYYFTLADFLVPALSVFYDVGLLAVVSFDAERAHMTIRDIDKPEDVILIQSPMGSADLKGCHVVQNIGAVETYQRRYLWCAALEIVEHDALDATVKTEKKERTGVAADVLAQGPALTPEELKYLDELAAEVLDLFKLTDGAKLCFERVERDKLDDMQKVYLSSRLPSNVRNPIKKYSQQYHASKKEQTA